MTAMAMIIGMLPMSLALGEGGEQNAPLGRAVIGGLLLATFSTLLFVPVVYSYLRTRDIPLEVEEEDELPDSHHHDIGGAAPLGHYHSTNGNDNANGHGGSAVATTPVDSPASADKKG